jgi:hypothetical protein
MRARVRRHSGQLRGNRTSPLARRAWSDESAALELGDGCSKLGGREVAGVIVPGSRTRTISSNQRYARKLCCRERLEDHLTSVEHLSEAALDRGHSIRHWYLVGSSPAPHLV